MKIAIDIRALSGAEYGGVSEYIKNLLPALFKEGARHNFSLLSNSYHKPRDYGTLFNYPNVQLHHSRYPNKFFTYSCRYLNNPKCDELVGGADIFFSPHFLPAPVSEGCPKVTTFHDLSFEHFSEFFDYKRRIWHKYISPRVQARSSDAIIAVSYSTAHDLEETYSIPAHKIHVVYSGLNDKFSDSQVGWNRVKRRYKLPAYYILSFTTLEPRKNLIALIRAFNILAQNKSFNDLSLVIAGAAGWSYKSIYTEAARSKCSERIIFTGKVRDIDKAHIYRHSKLFVYPSFWEGFGFPPLEAMNLGVPTLVSALSSLPEVVGDAALLIDPYRPGEMAQIILEVLTDNRLYEYYALKGKKRARGFNWSRTAQETLKVLESTV